MTINELAQLTGYANHSRISQFETGKRKPTLDFVYKVAEVFSVSCDLLLNDDLDLDEWVAGVIDSCIDSIRLN